LEIAILAVLFAAIVVWLIAAARENGAGGITYSQAIRFTLLRFFLGIRCSGFDPRSESRGPLVYCLLAQSRLDIHILRAFLPAQTFHIDASADGDTTHALPQFRSVMAGQGIGCLYLPPQVEASAATMRLLEEAGAAAREVGARIVPVFLRGTRFSLLSLWSPDEAPRSLLPQVTITAAPELSLAAHHDDGYSTAMLDGMARAKFDSVNVTATLFETLVAAARLHGPAREIVEDALGSRLSYRKLLIGARALGVRIAAVTRPGAPVGLMLPNSTGLIVTMFAILSGGRVAALLNYTAGPSSVVSALATANISTVLTSKSFIEKADLGDLIDRIRHAGVKVVHVEDLRDGIGFLARIGALLMWRRPLAARTAGEPAVILFTSGSEGTPKGVVLTSRSLVANAAQADCRVDFSCRDTLFNVLPLFHSFGLLGGAFLPLFHGVRLFLYPSPLHYKLIPTVARKAAPTVMFGTDTFLNGYARAAKAGDFDSLRMIVAGAEAVKPETRKMYRDRFGALIVEGYGMTEASPVVAVNSSTFFRDGTVGRLLPGMEMRVDPVEGIEDGGRFLIAGPNLMLGYLKDDRPGVIQPREGAWHDTGDIVSVDGDGFITIKGRAKRFAKIAGEMISLGAVEMMVKQLWPEADHAAIAVPDRRRGERIVLVTTQMPARKDEIIAYSRRYGATEMMIPDDIVNVETLPVLGSGKVDYAAAGRLVAGHAVG
jgi:acyl-[acyl-carrier-protein]-phospholipid O-acyltransferase/long-chain-fatty-acid--[acyl-carrier-protein] ligase